MCKHLNAILVLLLLSMYKTASSALEATIQPNYMICHPWENPIEWDLATGSQSALENKRIDQCLAGVVMTLYIQFSEVVLL